MNYTEQQLTAAVVSEGLRPVLAGPDTCAPAILLSLIQRCWDAKPQSRPSFNDIIAALDPIMEHRNRVEEEKKAFSEHSNSHNNLFINDIGNHRAYQESVNWFTQGEHLSKRASVAEICNGKFLFGHLNDPLAYQPILSWGSFASCGRRETMEDTHFLVPHMCNINDIHTFGIFDGHRGAVKLFRTMIKCSRIFC